VRVPPQDSRGLPGGRSPKIASPAGQIRRNEKSLAREPLSRHLWKVFAQGEHDPHRLTVQGLSYLQNLDRERDT
jgi:hypothetical protein